MKSNGEFLKEGACRTGLKSDPFGNPTSAEDFSLSVKNSRTQSSLF